ncbi:uncharacterized protein V1510DRAFT_367110 [Dipodascopsis tothii]|uniref:uncharacterized protein n=1 Tax=Dipodascopsis tothii TaxID=44089 RepID=UPI0034CEAD73
MRDQELHDLVNAWPRSARPSPWDVFGLKRTASQAEIKKKYYKLARAYHPDASSTTKLSETVRAERFKQVVAAYDALTKAPQTGGAWATADMNYERSPNWSNEGFRRAGTWEEYYEFRQSSRPGAASVDPEKQAKRERDNIRTAAGLIVLAIIVMLMQSASAVASVDRSENLLDERTFRSSFERDLLEDNYWELPLQERMARMRYMAAKQERGEVDHMRRTSPATYREKLQARLRYGREMREREAREAREAAAVDVPDEVPLPPPPAALPALPPPRKD